MEKVNLKDTQCPECGEELSSIQELENHFLSEHEEGDSNFKHEKESTPRKSKYEIKKYHCYHCDQEYTHQSKYITHFNTNHWGVDYACSHCDFKASHENILRNHIQSVHDVSTWYACNLCEYYAYHKGVLNNHVKSKHYGVNYTCDLCNHKAASKGSLKIHIKSIHEGVKYSCSQ